MFVFSMGVSIGNKKVKKKNYYPNQKKLPAKIGPFHTEHNDAIHTARNWIAFAEELAK